jgi:hypothetical protein
MIQEKSNGHQKEDYGFHVRQAAKSGGLSPDWGGAVFFSNFYL